jgi:hypothetical protein
MSTAKYRREVREIYASVPTLREYSDNVKGEIRLGYNDLLHQCSAHGLVSSFFSPSDVLDVLSLD